MSPLQRRMDVVPLPVAGPEMYVIVTRLPSYYVLMRMRRNMAASTAPHQSLVQAHPSQRYGRVRNPICVGSLTGG